MSQQQLGKPQLPPIDQSLYAAGTTSNPVKLSQIVKGLVTYLSSLVLYLQTYFNRLYSTLVPAQYTLTQVSAIQSPYQVGATDVFIEASASGTAATEIDLPASAGTGRIVVVTKADSGNQRINVIAASGDSMNGNTTPFSSGTGPGTAIVNQFDATMLFDTDNGWMAYKLTQATVT